MRKLPAVIVCLLILGAAVSSAEEGYEVYSNKKYGYEVKYPSRVFQPLAGAESDSGTVFISGEKIADMRVNAAEDVFGTTLAYAYEDMTDTDVIEKTLNEKEGWFTVTSLKESTVVYVKKILKNGVYYTLEIEYPDSEKDEFGPIVKAVSESFRVVPRAAD